MQGDGGAGGELSSPNLISYYTHPYHKISQPLLFRIKVINSQEEKNETTSAPDRQASVGVLRRILVTTDDE